MNEEPIWKPDGVKVLRGRSRVSGTLQSGEREFAVTADVDPSRGITSMTLTSATGEALTSRVLRDVPLSQIEAAALAGNRMPPSPDVDVAARGDDRYCNVALRYIDLQRQGVGRGVVQALATEWSVTDNLMRTWIRRAREKGYLSAARPGKAGAEPGPRLIDHVIGRNEP